MARRRPCHSILVHRRKQETERRECRIQIEHQVSDQTLRRPGIARQVDLVVAEVFLISPVDRYQQLVDTRVENEIQEERSAVCNDLVSHHLGNGGAVARLRQRRERERAFRCSGADRGHHRGYQGLGTDGDGELQRGRVSFRRVVIRVIHPVGHLVGAFQLRRPAEGAGSGVEAQPRRNLRTQSVAQGAVAAAGFGQGKAADGRSHRVALVGHGGGKARGGVGRQCGNRGGSPAAGNRQGQREHDQRDMKQYLVRIRQLPGSFQGVWDRRYRFLPPQYNRTRQRLPNEKPN